MTAPRSHANSPLIVALLGSGVAGGQYIAAKATQDALFLANYDTSSLPTMIIATAIVSIVIVVVSSRALRRVPPGLWVPLAFGTMGTLMLAEWILAASSPRIAAWSLYLLVSGFGPMLGSGFWLLTSERFDPHTAKKTFSRIAGAGTLGGLLAGLGAARVATLGGVRAMLVLAAGLTLLSAWLTRGLAHSAESVPRPDDRTAAPTSPRSGFRVLAEARYLRNLAALVLVGAMAETFIDQALKTQVKVAFETPSSLGSFFSLYYAALNLITFVMQIGGSRFVLERLGLGIATATPAVTFLFGGAAALLMPGLKSLVLTRGSEAACSASIYRPGYELFYTAIAPHDKRAVKSIIDVGFDRTGEIVGATIVQQLLWIPQPRQTRVLVSLAVAGAAIALFITRRLPRGYAEALERSLLNRAVELDLSEVEDLTTRMTMMRTLASSEMGRTATLPGRTEPPPPRPSVAPAAADPDVQRISALQSRDRDTVLRVLRSDRGPSAALVPYVISLLAWDAVSRDCIRALQSVAEERVGELTDALTDPNQPFVVRRRLARVFSVCVSQRAADAVLLGLEDLRFEVRYQSGRALLAIVSRNPRVRIDKMRIFALVNKEMSVNRGVWEHRRLLDAVEDSSEASFLEDLVTDRASHSLAHVFTLLALVLPTEPLRIAYRGLHTDDQALQGTSLEYLENVLPADIRDRLWPFLEDRRPAKTRRPGDETLADLLRSNESIRINLEELKRRASQTAGKGRD
jgi:hypothetical protein